MARSQPTTDDETATTTIRCPDCGAFDRFEYVAVTPGGETMRCDDCGRHFTDGQAERVEDPSDETGATYDPRSADPRGGSAVLGGRR